MMKNKYFLRCTDYEFKTIQSFKRLRHEEDFYDVTLVGDDHRQLSAHKMILSSASEYFRDVIKPAAKNGSLMICLEGTCYEDLEHVLEYIYTGEVQIQQEHVNKFLELGERLKLDGMIGVEDHEEELKIEKEIKLEKVEDMPVELKIEDEEYSAQEDVNKKESFKQSFQKIIEAKMQEKKIQEKHNPQKNKNQKVTKDAKVSKAQKSPQCSNIKVDDLKKPDRKMNQSFYTTEVTFESDSFPTLELLREKVDTMFTRDSGSLWCKTCPKYFKRLHHIREHVEMHIPGLRYKCNYCKKVKNSRVNFRQHICLGLNNDQ